MVIATAGASLVAGAVTEKNQNGESLLDKALKIGLVLSVVSILVVLAVILYFVLDIFSIVGGIVEVGGEALSAFFSFINPFDGITQIESIVGLTASIALSVSNFLGFRK